MSDETQSTQCGVLRGDRKTDQAMEGDAATELAVHTQQVCTFSFRGAIHNC